MYTGTEYDTQINELEQEIHRHKVMRDAQAEGSPNEQWFQDHINRLTGQMRHWHDNASRIQEADGDIRDARSRVRRAQAELDQTVERAFNTAKGAGVVGGVALVAVLLGVDAWWLVTAVVLLLGGATAAIVYGIRAKANHAEPLQQARAEVAHAMSRREALLPYSGAPVHAFAETLPDTVEGETGQVLTLVPDTDEDGEGQDGGEDEDGVM